MGFEFHQEQKTFFPLQIVLAIARTHIPSYSVSTVVLSLWVKLSVRDADHSLTSTAEVKNEFIYASTPHKSSWCEQAQLHHFPIYSYKVCCRHQAILWRTVGSPVPWLVGFNNPATDNRQYTQIMFFFNLLADIVVSQSDCKVNTEG